MKTQQTVFVLFLVAFILTSTRSWSQKYSLAPNSESGASQDAHRLGEEIQLNQPAVTEAQKGANRSIDAMHWTAASNTFQSQFVPAVGKRIVDSPKVTPVGMRTEKIVEEPIKTMEKPADQRFDKR